MQNNIYICYENRPAQFKKQQLEFQVSIAESRTCNLCFSTERDHRKYHQKRIPKLDCELCQLLFSNSRNAVSDFQQRRTAGDINRSEFQKLASQKEALMFQKHDLTLLIFQIAFRNLRDITTVTTIRLNITTVIKITTTTT